MTLNNVDRLERVTLEFPSSAIEEAVLEDLVRLMLGRDSAFLRRAPLAGVRALDAGAASSRAVTNDRLHERHGRA